MTTRRSCGELLASQGTGRGTKVATANARCCFGATNRRCHFVRTASRIRHGLRVLRTEATCADRPDRPPLRRTKNARASCCVAARNRFACYGVARVSGWANLVEISTIHILDWRLWSPGWTARLASFSFDPKIPVVASRCSKTAVQRVRRARLRFRVFCKIDKITIWWDTTHLECILLVETRT
jgi:hypothetical protein